MTSDEHRRKDVSSVACAVITVSDTRTPETDTSGALIREMLESRGHGVVGYDIVPDDPERVRERVLSLCDGAARVVILTGGTGLAPRDTTHEAISSLIEKRLDGFGELFRMLGYQEIGAAAMLSRAVAGTRGQMVIFSLPGSTAAVRLGMEKLILPELGHLVALLR